MKLSVRELFFIWFGAGISLAELFTGSFFLSSHWITVLLVLITGHLVGNYVLAKVGTISYQTGEAAMPIVERSFGKLGKKLFSSINALQLIGWTTIMLIIAGNSYALVQSGLGLPISEKFFVVIIGLLTILFCFWNQDLWRRIHKIFVGALFIVSLFLSIKIGLEIDWNKFVFNFSMANILSDLDLVVAMTLSWVPLIGDYTLQAKEEQGSFYGPFWGYFISSTLMFFLGFLLTQEYGQADLLLVSKEVSYLIVVFIVIFGSTITTTFLDLYSGVISTKQLFPSGNRKKILISLGLVSIGLALFFNMQSYEAFLLFLGSAFLPLYIIVLADYFIFELNYTNIKVNRSNFIIWLVSFLSYHLISIRGKTLFILVLTFIIKGTYEILKLSKYSQ